VSFIIHFRFDQADLEVAAVDFIKLSIDPARQSIVPSSLALCEVES